MRRAVSALFLALLIVLAGCSAGIGTQGPSSPDGTENSDPTENYVLPPGLSESGVTDIEDLAAAHAESLKDRSYEYTEVLRVERSETVNETKRSLVGRKVKETRRRIIVEGSSFLYTYKDNDTRVVRWSDGRNVLISHTENDTTYIRRRAVENEADAFGFYVSTLLERYISEEGSTVSQPVERNGTAMVWVTSSTPPQRLSGPNIDGYKAVALVSMSGTVHEMFVEYDEIRDGKRVHISRRFRYSPRVGGELTRPSWYGKAMNSSFNPTKKTEVIKELAESRVITLDLRPGIDETLGFLPGVDSDVSSFEALENVYYEALNTTTYAFSERYMRLENGTHLVYLSNESTVIGENALYSNRVEIVGRNGELTKDKTEVWSNDTIRVIAKEEAGTTNYIGINSSSGPYSPVDTSVFARRLSRTFTRFFDGRNVTFFGPLNWNGTEVIWIIDTHRYDTKNYTAIAAVDTSGIVRRIRVEYENHVFRTVMPKNRSDTMEIEHRIFHVSYSLDVSKVGKATAEKPTWFTKAIENITKPTIIEIGDGNETKNELLVKEVNDTPEDAVIVNSSVLRDVESVLSALERVKEEPDKNVFVSLNEKEYERAEKALKRLPHREDEDSIDVYMTYVDDEGEKHVVLVRLRKVVHLSVGALTEDE